MQQRENCLVPDHSRCDSGDGLDGQLLQPQVSPADVHGFSLRRDEDGKEQKLKTRKYQHHTGVKGSTRNHKGSVDPEICMHLDVTSPRVWVTPEGGDRVMCDTQTDGGGWIVIQRRTHGETNFNRSWEEYKVGFSGEKGDEFYIGNKVLEALSRSSALVLRVDLIHKRLKYFQKYKDFRVSDEARSYSLCVVDWSGTAGDGLTPGDDHWQSVVASVPFSTYDHPGMCSSSDQGGWWSKGCDSSNLNGEWKGGVRWYRLTSGDDAITFTEMKVRPDTN
ncbi:fibrinogen-like protein 1 [Physella acuta]|uniref:fibrinogen-like protein 1 n=1 Tax=Physella acuta TaxID=109671 RepID=UPI0027DCA261|nr:fibrinogen-like protein 1 [Physella acuta]